MGERRSGVLLHITSLPSEHGIGDLGPWAYRFAEFLAGSGQRVWQVLPVTPTEPGCGNSPYSSPSAFAGNRYLVSPELLARDGLLSASDLAYGRSLPRGYVDYERAVPYKESLLRKAYRVFCARETGDEGYEAFCEAAAPWLDDVARFNALRRRYPEAPWYEWPEPLRRREPDALAAVDREMADEIGYERFCQYIFQRQWAELKRHCNGLGISLFGDIPIYVDLSSADVWAHPELFKLAPDGRPTAVAGVPPDYFSETGQLWGNPVYNWEAHRADGFSWWARRIGRALELYDLVRIDHFRGFSAYWEVPAGAPNAMGGHWEPSPGPDLFRTLFDRFPGLPVVAEDLGVITDDVRALMAEFGIPGMKVLIFAWGDDTGKNPYLPHNIGPNSIVYTGTHDTNTAKGWFVQEAREDEKRRLAAVVGPDLTAENVHDRLIRLAMSCKADTAIIPMQDLLALDHRARMNTPNRSSGNWSWRLRAENLNEGVSSYLRGLAEDGGRVR